MQFKALWALLFACSQPAILAEFTEESALKYLKQYGYIHSNTHDVQAQKESGHASESDHNFQQALMDFQSFTGLQQTGRLDQATENVMKTPRCGVKDYPSLQFVSNQQRTQSQQEPGKWDKKKLTYRVIQYSTKISNTEVDETCRKAMDLWEEAADIKFQQAPKGKVDIEISFKTGDHGEIYEECDDPFDGKSTNDNPNVLAHAFFPNVRMACDENIAGDIHIDDDEDWPVIYHNKRHDLLHTMTHELGHSLGLEHQLNFDLYPTPSIASPIMQPNHPGFITNLTLHTDDIKRVQKLYGKPKTTTKTTESTPTVLQPPTGQRCKGRNYGKRRCCTPQNPCDEGEGDCDGPGDGGQNDGHDGCKGHLVCGSNNCLKFASFYHEKDDCCEKPSTSQDPSQTEEPFWPEGWSSWGAFSQCSRTCGRGKKSRHRTCTGTSCTRTQQIQERPCNLTPCQEQNHYGYIESIEPGAQHDTENAIWGEDEWCNDGSLAVGIDLKILYNQGSVYDDNALNAIKLICSGQGGQSNITSLDGSHGDWRGAKRCGNGYITGVSLRSEKYQGKFKDDTAANGVRASCEDGQEIRSTNLEGYWGTWSGLEQCPQGTAICGIKTKVELSCFGCSLDNVALTRAKFHCGSKQ